MHLDLSHDDARLLYECLQAYLSELRREVAATDAREMRHQLGQRQELCERLINELGQATATPEMAHHQL